MRFVIFGLLAVLVVGCRSADTEQQPDLKNAGPAVESWPVPDDLFNDYAVKQAFKHSERQQLDKRVANMALQYSYIAKGFWADKRCDILSPSLRQTFIKDVALATKTMGYMLADEPSFNDEKVTKKTELLQMYSLNELSTRKFYGCTEPARHLVKYAVLEAAKWRETVSRAMQIK